MTHPMCDARLQRWCAALDVDLEFDDVDVGLEGDPIDARRHRTRRPSLPQRAFLVTLAVVVAATTGCPSRREGLSRDALERRYEDAGDRETLPSVADLLKLRFPAVPTEPDARTGTAIAQAFAAHDDARLAAVVDDETMSAATRSDARWLRCLLADARLDPQGVSATCSAFARGAPADLRVVAALHLLRAHRGGLQHAQLTDARTVAEEVLAGCPAVRGAGSCALIAFSADRLWRAMAVEDGAPEVVAALPKHHLLFTDVQVEGPFLSADEHFTGASFANTPPRRHPLAMATTLRAPGGTFEPGARLPGFYRLSTTIKTGSTAATLFYDGGQPTEIKVDGLSVVVSPQGVSGPDVFVVPLALTAGFHEIEVMTFDGGGTIRLALLDNDGRPVATPSRTSSPVGVTAQSSVRSDDRGLATFLVPPSFQHTNDVSGDADLLVAVMTRMALDQTGLGRTVDDVRAVAPGLVRRFGWSAPALIAAADILDTSPLPDRIEDALAGPLWAAAEQAWPEAVGPALVRARREARESPERAIEIYRALLKAHPTSTLAMRELIPALLELDVVDEAAATARALLAIDDNQRSVRAVIPALEASGAITEAAALRQRLSLRRDDELSIRRGLLAPLDTPAATLSALEQLLAAANATGVDTSTESPLVDGDLVAGPRAAAALWKRTASIANDVEVTGKLLSRLQAEADGARRLAPALDAARLLASLGRRDDALKLLRAPAPSTLPQALQQGPADLDRIMLEEALGVSTPWAHRAALAEERLQAWRAREDPFPGYGSAILLDDLELFYAADGSALEVVHWMAELRSKAAIDGAGELRAGDGEVLLTLRVLKPDGRVLEPEHHTGIRDISLTGLSAGDVVEWLSVSVNQNGRDGDAWRARQLQNAVPAMQRRLIVHVPDSLRTSLRFVTSDRAPTPTTSTGPVSPALGGNQQETITTFTVSDAPALLAEPLSVSPWEAVPVAGVVLGDPLRLPRQRARAQGLWPARPDPWLREAARSIAGAGADDDKLRRLFRFVAENIQSANDPDDAISTLAVGRGDRLILLCALARAVGLPASFQVWHSPLSAPSSLPTSELYANTVLFITANGIDHAVAAIGDGLVLDRLGGIVGAPTIDSQTGATGVIAATMVDDSPVHVEVDLHVERREARTLLVGLAALRLPAPAAEGVRAALRRASEENLQHYVAAGLGQSFPGVRVTRVTIPGLASAGGPLALLADVEVDIAGLQAMDSDVPTVRLEHLFPRGAAAAFQAGLPLSELLRVAERQRPMRLPPSREVLDVTLRLPPDASFVEVPPTTRLEAGPLIMAQQSEVHDGSLHWHRTLDIALARVEVAAWPALRGALAPMVSAADARIAFVVQHTSADGADGPTSMATSTSMTTPPSSP